MQRYSASFLRTLATDVFTACGAPREEASIVANQLVASNLMGLDSHGVVMIPKYVGWVREGTTRPAAPICVVSEQGGTAVMDCGLNFGQVGGQRAMEKAIALARQHKVACVVTTRCRHVGRLGYFTQMAAEADMLAIASVNSARAGHSVVPYGGLLGRLAPNPISYAVPGPEHPIIADMAMSTTSKGKTVVYRNRGQKLPEGWIIDAQGNPTTDPEELFKEPKGWILPLGGNVGYKGFAFLLLSEILGGALGGHAITEDIPDGVNGVCFIVLDISAFQPVERFRELMGDMIAYEKSAPPAPGFKEVLMPGELDFRIMAERQAQGIPIDPVTWGQIRAAAEGLHVTIAAQG